MVRRGRIKLEILFKKKLRNNIILHLVRNSEKICEELDKRVCCLVYSVDLSAAFNLLLSDTFYDNLKDRINPDLIQCKMDSLTNGSRIFRPIQVRQNQSAQCKFA